MTRKISRIEALDRLDVLIFFEDGKRGVFEGSNLIKDDKRFLPLNEESFFNQVEISDNQCSLKWPGNLVVSSKQFDKYCMSYSRRSNRELHKEVGENFASYMQILRENGYSREESKRMIRNSGLIEKCRTRSGAEYVIHHNVEDWCYWMMHGCKWMIDGRFYPMLKKEQEPASMEEFIRELKLRKND